MHSILDPSQSALLPSADEIAAMDRATIASGTPSLELMERAGHGMFDALIQAIAKEKELLDHTLILVGPGNNGGDGLVLARLIIEAGFNPKVVLCSSSKYSNDCRIQIQKLTWAEIDFYLYDEPVSPLVDSSVKVIGDQFLTNLLKGARIVVDALLGSGQKEAPRGSIGKVVQRLQQAGSSGKRPFVMAVDLPTGINCDTGEAYEGAVSADLTVTVELIKRGMRQSPARELCGKVVIVPIGLDISAGTQVRLLKPGNLRKLSRNVAHHKGDSGHVFVLAGSRAMPGASELCGLAALRAGAGLVTRSVLPGMGNSVPEIMTVPLGNAKSECFDAKMLSTLSAWIEKADVFVIGPGLGTDSGTSKLLYRFLASLSEAGKACVLDADALNIIAVAPKNFAKMLERAVITPHPGEAARLLGVTANEIQRDRVLNARRLLDLGASVAVLKGASSVVCCAHETYVNSSGNPFMATAGSGDVLAGVIAALAWQFEGDLLEASKTAVFVHGRSGDLAHRRHNGPIIATDLIGRIPFALGEL